MSFFRIFDWMNPLFQSAQEGETVCLSSGQIDELKREGWIVHCAFEDLRNLGTWCAKVSPPQEERGLKIF